MATISPEVKELLAKAAQLEQEKRELKEETKKLDEKVTALNVQIEKISARVHKEVIMEDDMDTESFTISLLGVGTFELAIEPYFNVLAANRHALLQKLKENRETHGLVKESVHPATLKAFCRETLADQGMYPYPELISVFNKPILKIKKG